MAGPESADAAAHCADGPAVCSVAESPLPDTSGMYISHGAVGAAVTVPAISARRW